MPWSRCHRLIAVTIARCLGVTVGTLASPSAVKCPLRVLMPLSARIRATALPTLPCLSFDSLRVGGAAAAAGAVRPAVGALAEQRLGGLELGEVALRHDRVAVALVAGRLLADQLEELLGLGVVEVAEELVVLP